MTSPDQAQYIFLEWLEEVVNVSPENAPTTLWHYTDAAGLMGILSESRLRATDTAFLNDSVELSYGTDLFLQALNEKVESSSITSATRAFVRGLADPEGGIVRPWLDGAFRLFVVCFCASGDLLSQWRAYGGRDGAGGYAIGFTPPGPLPAWAQSAPHYLTLRRVIYDETEQREMCDRLLTPLLAFLDANPRDVGTQGQFAAALVNGLTEFAGWCKHPTFAEENEWRLAYTQAADLEPIEPLHRASNGLVSPFVQLEAPGNNPDVLPITAVRCGPSLEPERKSRGVASLMVTLPQYATVDIRHSGAPVRL